jgi:starch-binding outer membrane protein, SusD/RagB family
MVNHGESTPFNAMIKEALLEKYCSVIGVPSFLDVNRTNNLINVPIKNANVTTIPQRFIYSSAEQASNSNFPGLVDQYVKTDINN